MGALLCPLSEHLHSFLWSDLVAWFLVLQPLSLISAEAHMVHLALIPSPPYMNDASSVSFFFLLKVRFLTEHYSCGLEYDGDCRPGPFCGYGMNEKGSRLLNSLSIGPYCLSSVFPVFQCV